MNIVVFSFQSLNLPLQLYQSGLVLLEVVDPLTELVDGHLLLQALPPRLLQLLLQLLLLPLLLEDDLVQALLVLAPPSEWEESLSFLIIIRKNTLMNKVFIGKY